MSVLNCLFDSVSQMLRKNVEKKMLLDKLDNVFLAIDEICDGGYCIKTIPLQQCIFRDMKHKAIKLLGLYFHVELVYLCEENWLGIISIISIAEFYWNLTLA